MKTRKFVSTIVAALAMSFLVLGPSRAQAPSKANKTGAKGKSAQAMTVYANLAQLMRGVFFPNSNVVFAAQDTNPAEVAQAKDPSLAVNPLEGVYGKWEAVENSGLALAEAANLLLLPRKCSNGLDAPINNPDWPGFVQGMRDAGMKSYEAAKSKNQDNILDAADAMVTACANCHDRYRDKPELADRCK